MIDSEGYVFCQKLTAESMKTILAASSCVRELTANVLSRSKELAEKGLLNLNRIQHWDANGKAPSPDFLVRQAALGANVGNFAMDPSDVPAVALTLEAASKFFGFVARRDKDLEGGAKVEESAALAATFVELGILWNSNRPLAALVTTAKFIVPVLNKLDQFALEHGQDWRTKTGGDYVR